MNWKKFIKLTVVIYIAVGFFLIFGKTSWFPEFYNPRFMGGLAFVSVLLMLAPHFVFNSNGEQRQQSVFLLQKVVTVTMILNGLGGLGLYQLYRFGFEYDKLMHFVGPMLFTVSASYLLHSWYATDIKKSLGAAVIIVMLFGIGWEFFELFADLWFGTETLGQYGQGIPEDTVVDIIMNSFGTLSGALWIMSKKEFWHDSENSHKI